jgi:hypothetical protein
MPKLLSLPAAGASPFSIVKGEHANTPEAKAAMSSMRIREYFFISSAKAKGGSDQLLNSQTSFRFRHIEMEGKFSEAECQAGTPLACSLFCAQSRSYTQIEVELRVG